MQHHNPTNAKVFSLTLSAALAAALLVGISTEALADQETQNKAWVRGAKDEEFKASPVSGTIDGQPVTFKSATYNYDDFGYRIRFQTAPSRAKPAVEIWLRTKDVIVGKTMALPLPRVSTPYGPMPGSTVSKITAFGTSAYPDDHSGRISIIPSNDSYLVGYVVVRAAGKDMKQTWLNGYFYAVPKK